MATAELHQAFAWDCDECGRENFCRAVTMETTPDEKRMMAAQAMGVEPFEVPDEAMQGEWLMAPESVTCGHCGHEFETKQQHED